MYAGVAALQTGDFQGAIDQLKKYDGKDPILKARAEACIGDAYTELQDYKNAISYYQKAAKTTDNALAAAYLLKAGIAAGRGRRQSPGPLLLQGNQGQVGQRSRGHGN